jgi:hypothetical protein
MGELLPVVAGLILGLVVAGAQPQGDRLRWLLPASVVVGLLASLVSGELELSPAFLLIDIPLALIGMAAGVWLRDGALRFVKRERRT